MENPANWNEATRVINEAIERRRLDDELGYCGLSLALTIHNALLAAGFIITKDSAT